LTTIHPAFAPTVGEFFGRYDALPSGQQATAAGAATTVGSIRGPWLIVDFAARTDTLR
jgi:hypothetical protein